MPNLPTSPTLERGVFIVSLDCEGKWGMADRIGPAHASITSANLIGAYGKLLRLFDDFGVPATFAFVFALILGVEERRRFADQIADVNFEGANWLRHYRAAEARGDLDGWFCPEALEMVRSDPRHEIACHGFTHVPLEDGAISCEEVRRELRACRAVASLKGITPSTFVYPRNQVGHVDELRSAGFIAYRDRIKEPSRAAVRKAAGLLREFNVREHSQRPCPKGPAPIVIPHGHFITWQAGPRRAVPRSVSRRRWSHILGDAARRRQVAHLWLHPHNLITGPNTEQRLSDILAEAAALHQRGLLDIMTQEQYARNMLAEASEQRAAGPAVRSRQA